MACAVNPIVEIGVKEQKEIENVVTVGEGHCKESNNVDLSDKPASESAPDNELTVASVSVANEGTVINQSTDCNNAKPTEEQDDVPANFFDELMTEDFMDGLNVVDAWDEEEKAEKKDELHKKAQTKPDSRQRTKSPSRRERRRERSPRKRSPEKKRSTEKKRSPERKRSPEKKRSPVRKRSPIRKRSPATSKVSEEKRSSNERRDPTKTQRDILRDKDKCAKDQKAKLISEKLRVVETGLVPPGMEMEVDLGQIQVAEKEPRPRRTSAEHRRIPPVRRRPFELHPSPPRRIRRSSSLERIKRSPGRWIYGKEEVIVRRRISRSRSPRVRSPSRILKSVERRIRERRRFQHEERASKSRSPRRRVRSKTPGSDVSERERWLRFRSKSPKSGLTRRQKMDAEKLKDAKFRRRSRSNSPTRLSISRKTKSFLEELNDKLSMPTDENNSFLKEISKKLNPQTAYVPVPVPAPQQNFPGPARRDYDQEFFIGQPDIVRQFPPSVPQQHHQQHSFLPQEMVPQMIPPHQFLMAPQPVPLPSFAIPMTQNNTSVQTQYYENEKEAFTNLFKDKKISLTDYLSVTAKFTDNSRPVNIQNKIKVISECQDAIKELNGEAKTTGRFTLKKFANTLGDNQENKWRSPMKRNTAVRFNFTHHVKWSEKKPTMVSSLNRLLSRFNKELIFEEVLRMEAPSTPEPPFIVHRDTKSQKKKSRTISCQTDPIRCDECLIRKYKVYLESHTQTVEALCYDIACQVNLDESPSKNVLKNQSLAYMTPAQLLAQNKRESPSRDLKYDHHSSPDPKRARISHPDDAFDRYGDVDNRFSKAPMFDRDRGVGRSSMDSVFVMRNDAESFNQGRPEVFGSLGRSRMEPVYSMLKVSSFNSQGRGMEPPGYNQGVGMEPPYNGRSMEQISPPFRGRGGPPRQGFEPNNFGRGRRFQ